MSPFINLGMNVLALFVVEYLVPGFKLASFWTAVVAAIVIGIINTFLKPVLQLLAFPISILTFGLAAFLINVLLLKMAATLVPGFVIESFGTAVIASIVLTLVSWFLHSIAS